jgi:fatty acid synthase
VAPGYDHFFALPNFLQDHDCNVTLSGLWNLPTRNGKMPNLDKFDNEFFGISAEEVAYVDPQERLLMEHTYEAIIDAGVFPYSFPELYSRPD